MDVSELDRKLEKAWAAQQQRERPAPVAPPVRAPRDQPARAPRRTPREPDPQFEAVMERHKNLFENRRLLMQLDTEQRWRMLGYVICGRD